MAGFEQFSLHLSPILITCLLGVVLILVFASTSLAVLARRAPEKDWKELTQRVRTWWWIVALFTLTLLGNKTLALCVFALISFLAFKEFLTLSPTRAADHVVLFWAYLSIPLQYFWLGISWYGMFIIFVPVYAFLILPCRMVLIGETKGFVHAASSLHWALMLTVFCLSHLAALLILPEVSERRAVGEGSLLLFFVVGLTQLNDVMQYLWGKSLGRHRVAPKVSPNKTWEGFLGGAASTTALACFLGPLLTPMDVLHSAGAGLLIGITGFVGDVVISAVKRDIGVKDSGTLLPGHGGILDRLDSLTYTAPLFFHYIRYFYY